MAAPATGLSCAEPEPVDWSTRLPATDASVIGALESLKKVEGDEYARELLLQVRVTERLGSQVPA